MYEDYYHLNDKAFPCQPTPSVFFESPIHTGASRFLTSGLREQEPFLLIFGNYGMGKTLLCLRAIRHLASSSRPFVDLSTPVGSYRELLELLLIRCGISPDSTSEDDLQSQFLAHIDVVASQETTFSILLDEVQDYQAATLSKIRMLSNYNVDGFYPLQFIFFAHPSLLDLLSEPQLEPLDQRIRRRYFLMPFSLAETKEYIYFRLLQSGATGSPYFPDDSIKLIQQYSDGTPRFINNICDACMLFGAAKNISVIDSETTQDAIDSLGIAESRRRREAILAGDSYDEDQDEEEIKPAPALIIKSMMDEEPAEAAASKPEAQAEPTPEPIPAKPPLRVEEQDEDEDEDQLHPAGQSLLPNMSNALLTKIAVCVIIALILAALWQRRGQFIGAIASQASPSAQHGTISEETKIGPKEVPMGTPTGNQQVAPVNTQITTPSQPPLQNQGIGATSSGVEASEEPVEQSTYSATSLGEVRTPKTIPGNAGFTPSNNPMYQPGFTPAQPLVSGPRPYSLLVNSSVIEEVSKTLSASLTRTAGMQDVYVSKEINPSGSMSWAVLQGFYGSEAEAVQASNRLNLAGTTPLLAPKALAISTVGADQQTLTMKLNQAGHSPYTMSAGPAAGQLLVGAYATLDAATRVQQSLQGLGITSTVVNR